MCVFLTAPSVCRGLNCSPPPCRAEQRICRIVHGSDCHSQCLDPLLRGRTERFGGGRTVQPLWGRIFSIYKRLWGKSLQCQIVRVGVSQSLNRRWPIHQGTDNKPRCLDGTSTNRTSTGHFDPNGNVYCDISYGTCFNWT
jgi:hypothetical protein